jgi:hypothetical protein
MPAMDDYSKLTRLAGAAVLSLALTAGTATVAVATPADDAAEEEDAGAGPDSEAELEEDEAPVDEAEAVEDVDGGEAAEEEEGGKIQLAETPRDRVGLIMLAALGVMTLGGAVTVIRQIGGKRPQADGEFRWR